MNIEFSVYPTALAVKIIGELDQYAAARLKSSIDIECEETRRRNIIFDLSEVTMMDSSGIGLMIGRLKKLRPIGGGVAAAGANGSVRRVIELSGLTQLVPLYQMVDEALLDFDAKEGAN